MKRSKVDRLGAYACPLRSVKARQVLEIVVLRGDGTEQNVLREVNQYWTLDGELLAEHDPWQEPA